jgi:hypothetical protein
MDPQDDPTGLKRPCSVFTERKMSMSLRSIQEERATDSGSNLENTTTSENNNNTSTPAKSVGRKYQRHQPNVSRSRSRIIDRSRNDYVSYLEHRRPSTDQADKKSIRSYASTRLDGKFDAPKMDMYRHDRPPTGQFPPMTGYSEEPWRLETGATEQPTREVSEHRRMMKMFLHLFLALFFTG